MYLQLKLSILEFLGITKIVHISHPPLINIDVGCFFDDIDSRYEFQRPSCPSDTS